MDDPTLNSLDPGERAAIGLGISLRANIILAAPGGGSAAVTTVAVFAVTMPTDPEHGAASDGSFFRKSPARTPYRVPNPTGSADDARLRRR